MSKPEASQTLSHQGELISPAVNQKALRQRKHFKRAAVRRFLRYLVKAPTIAAISMMISPMTKRTA
jgi:hypothetical protein